MAWRAARFAALLGQGGMWVIEAGGAVAGGLQPRSPARAHVPLRHARGPALAGAGLWPFSCHLEVLRGSGALAFWRALGFSGVGEAETDIVSERAPRA